MKNFTNKKLQLMYELELAKLNEKFRNVQEVLNTLPKVCEDYIIHHMKQQPVGIILDKYKEIWFSWGCHRQLYKAGKFLTNKKDAIQEDMYLISIYINTLDLYNSHERYGLDKLADKCFYYDSWNSTFYCKDSEFEKLLEALNNWFVSAKKLEYERRKIKRRKELLKELENLENTACN